MMPYFWALSNYVNEDAMLKLMLQRCWLGHRLFSRLGMNLLLMFVVLGCAHDQCPQSLTLKNHGCHNGVLALAFKVACQVT